MSIVTGFIDFLTGGHITELENRIAALEDYIVEKEVR